MGYGRLRFLGRGKHLRGMSVTRARCLIGGECNASISYNEWTGSVARLDWFRRTNGRVSDNEWTDFGERMSEFGRMNGRVLVSE